MVLAIFREKIPEHQSIFHIESTIKCGPLVALLFVERRDDEAQISNEAGGHEDV